MGNSCKPSKKNVIKVQSRRKSVAGSPSSLRKKSVAGSPFKTNQNKPSTNQSNKRQSNLKKW